VIKRIEIEVFGFVFPIWIWPLWDWFRPYPYAQWWWEKQLGGGPRWLRQTWCLVFHWYQFRPISDTQCGEAFPFSNLEGTRGVVHRTECLDHTGCGICQFTWWTKRRIETRQEIKEPFDGGQERNRVDGSDLEPPGGVLPGVGGVPPLLRGAASLPSGGYGEQPVHRDHEEGRG
jgi:hypothetical protein